MKIFPRSFGGLLPAAFAAFVLVNSPAIFAQDSSGNALLNASFRFRYVSVSNESTNGQVTAVSAEEGVITFQGNGNYTITAGSQWNDPLMNNGAFQSIGSGATGTYYLSPSGIGYLQEPDPDPNLPGGYLNITFAQGVITGSSTESGLNDYFVAIASGTPPTNATFNSPYWIGTFDFAASSDLDVKNALFQITPDGAGNLGSLSVIGWANSNSGNEMTQTVSGAKYNFASDGNAQFSIPAPTPAVTSSQILVSGSRTVYVSSDGNFLLGWTPNGYDIIFGVKALPSSVTATDSLYSGVYYQSGIGDQPNVGGTQNCGPYNFWGSLNADGNENEWMHQRLLWACSGYSGQYGPISYDLETWDATIVNPPGQTLPDGSPLPNGAALDLPLGSLSQGSAYIFGDAGGNCASNAVVACAFIAISNTPGSFGLTIGIHTPNFTSPGGIWLDPVGVFNAASFQPITASVAPGEFITLFGNFGTNLPAGGLIAKAPYPTQLGPIQVSINGQAAPIYFASATQINVIAPFELAATTPYDEATGTGSVTAEVQVSNGTSVSNSISVLLLTDANPGAFACGIGCTGVSDGIGNAIAEHGDGSLVCDPSADACSGTPANPNEEIVLGMGGMGTVTPQIGDGAVPAPSASSCVDDYPNYLDVYFQDYDNNVFFQPATINYACTYAGYPGEYQMNITIPTTIGPGDDIYMEVVTPYTDIVQVAIPIGGSANAGVKSALSKPQSRPAHALFSRPAGMRSPHPMFSKQQVPARPLSKPQARPIIPSQPKLQ